jgi:hypothetical protein
MASMGWEKTGRRWRVFWHVTLRDGALDKGIHSTRSQSFRFSGTDPAHLLSNICIYYVIYYIFDFP